MVEVNKYWHHRESDGLILLAYGIPYNVHAETEAGTITIDPTIQFQEGLGGYSGSSLTPIRGDDNSTQDLNFGRDTTLKISDLANGVHMRTLVKFDLSDLGGVSVNHITGAYYLMKLIELGGPDPGVTRLSSAYRIKKNWNEGNGFGGIYTGGVTWNSAKHGSVLWDVPGVDGSGDREGNSTSDDTEVLTTNPDSYDFWLITESMKEWLSGTQLWRRTVYKSVG